MNDDLRYLHKWLNEEQTAPIDRVALAKMLALVTEMGEALEEVVGTTYSVDEALAKYREMTK